MTPKLTRPQGLTFGSPPKLSWPGFGTGLTYTGDDGGGPTPPGGLFRPWGFGDNDILFDSSDALFDGAAPPTYNPWNWGTADMRFDDATAAMDGTYTP